MSIYGSKLARFHSEDSFQIMEGLGGYDAHDFVKPEELTELFFCGICQGVARDLVETKCGHIYCEQCLLAWTRTRNECPIDRQPLDGDHSVYPVESMRRFINQKPVKCPNRNVGCKASLTVQQLEFHVDFECEYQKAIQFKKLEDFPDEHEYGKYLQRVLRFGMLVRCVNVSEKVEEGDFGMFLKFQSGDLPIQVRWSDFGHRRWVRYRDVEVYNDRDDKKLMNLQIEHENILMEKLQPGMKVMAIRSFQSTPQGDVGTFITRNNKYPPVQVQWESLGRNSWVVWNSIEIIQGLSKPEIQERRLLSHPMRSLRVAKIEEEKLNGPSSDNEFKSIADFDSEVEYSEYMKRVLVSNNSMVRTSRTFAKVKENDLGLYIQHNSSYPPCQIRWKDFGHARWFFWRDLELIKGDEDDRNQLIAELGHERLIKRSLKPGSIVMAVSPFLSVPQGTLGEFIEHNEKYPPCKIRWNYHGKELWVLWKDIVDVTGFADEKVKAIRRKHTNKLIAERPYLSIAATQCECTRISQTVSRDAHCGLAHCRANYKSLADFDSEFEYATFMMSRVNDETWLQSVFSEDRVSQGDIGLFVSFNYSYPPCQVYWKDFRHTRWFYWRDVRMIPPPEAFIEDKVKAEMAHAQHLRDSLQPGMKVIAKEPFLGIPQGAIGTYVETSDNYPPCKVDWEELGMSHWVTWSGIDLLRGDEDDDEISTIRRTHLEEMLESVEELSDDAQMTLKTVRDFNSEFEFAKFIQQSAEHQSVVVQLLEDSQEVSAGDIGVFLEFSERHPPCKVRWRQLGVSKWVYWRHLGVIKDGEDERKVMDEIIEDEMKLKERIHPGSHVMAIKSLGQVHQGQIGTVIEWDDGAIFDFKVKWQGISEPLGISLGSIECIDGLDDFEVEFLKHKYKPYHTDFACEYDHFLYLKDFFTVGGFVRDQSGDIGMIVSTTQELSVRWLSKGLSKQERWTDLVADQPSVQERGMLERDMRNESILRRIVNEQGSVEVVSLVDTGKAKAGELGRVFAKDVEMFLYERCLVRWYNGHGDSEMVPWNSISVSINQTEDESPRLPLSKRFRKNRR